MSSEFGDFSPFRARSAVKPGLESAFRRRAGIGESPAGRRRSRPGGGRRARGRESTTMTMLPSANSYCDGFEFQRPGHMSSAFPEARRERPETARNDPRNCHGRRFAPTIPAFPANPGSTAKSPASARNGARERTRDRNPSRPAKRLAERSRFTRSADPPSGHRPARRKRETARCAIATGGSPHASAVVAYARPQALRSSSALSVRSHVNSGSSRPKWP